MRVRYRRSAVLKLAVLVIGALIAIPFLIHYLDSSESAAALKFRKNRQLARDKPQSHKIIHDSKREEVVQNVVDKPAEIQNEDKVEESIKSDGDPQSVAIMKEGILGNYEPTDYPNRNGPGEKGQPVYTSMEEKIKADQSVREFGFNMVNSDKIAMDRTIPDTRMEECKYWHYPEQLPTASVILVFHNEGWSTLMRTVHSVINMSPPHLLKEVVMVDDFSSKEHLKDRLEQYVKQFNGKVKLYRNPERMGLIRTRTRGAELSTGDVIVFLDAHCECQKNWLPPLLTRIKNSRTRMAVPIVDGIDWDNFRYHPVYTTNHHRGIFEWGFLYKESLVPKKELDTRKYHSEPYKLFPVESNKCIVKCILIWQCGGSIEWVPCSRVGHVYRNHMPYGFGKVDVKIPVIQLNYMRVIHVWLDEEHIEYFYTREPGVRGYPVGDITKQLQFKKDHKCKSFKWFLDNIAYEVYEKFPPLPPNKVWGEFVEAESNQCMDTVGQGVGGGPIGVSGCHHFGGNQVQWMNLLELHYQSTVVHALLIITYNQRMNNIRF
ncbi:hypothetical protein KUTeg_013541 [Tegillarca granosa]|uniref:Polypeptide N-acetylgalactosaminyltransferase n=1 Tax=Tegillarca granosa TaxID=220873 RepID=A0ABQ9EYH6_TEGGR|nr:hypothetical protein KUTeg_013541 [Tegillarca granosa]